MNKPLRPSALRVQAALDALGFSFQVMELSDSTRTAFEAAQAVGCNVGQIAKSLIFRGKRTDKPILVIASGANRVDETKLSALVGETVVKAKADFVRQHTGFAIGGVPPVGHTEPLETWIDQDLLQYDVIWAAAGTPRALFQLSPQNLAAMTGGQVVELKA